MKKALVLFSLLATVMTGTARADDAAIKQTLQTKLGVNQVEIMSSPIPGLQTVLTEGGILYVSSDGKHILQGPLYDVSGASVINATSKLLEPILIKRLDALKDQMIVYKAPKEKYVVTVFTDVTCGYCRKLHQEMKGYNELGITVRYLAFPRQGIDSEAEKTMQSIWCASDRLTTFTDAMAGKAVTPKTCDADIKAHYQLGALFGISGTPAIILDDGSVVSGYMAPTEMKEMLETYTAHKKAGVAIK